MAASQSEPLVFKIPLDAGEPDGAGLEAGAAPKPPLAPGNFQRPMK